MNSGINGPVDGNTYIGYGAGRNNENGLSNVFIGRNAGAFEEDQYCALIIENSDTIAPLIYGEFENEILKFNGETRVVDHDVYVTNPDCGIILTSPSGYCYRVRVDDAGNFVSQLITCP